MKIDTGHITYDVYTITGTVQLDVTYQVELEGIEYEITSISIQPVDPSKGLVAFSLEDEMEEIIEECIKDYALKKELLPLEDIERLKVELHRLPQVQLAAKGYDFSAN